ncbi:PREDICTED: vacuolar protein sorting-associated protein 53 homolog isoform X1 [Rhagoletis zephyria]|uniref:vacuolar protein sorting-associated protein 53 homolog isoform X1 n=1 Tax=Rhagoletis zephyria TaxID=28612 RepID=UPI00081187F9|nr:PREDICTED: vacuolar protein sorting-associated protein 53 homolog isoform X1 [Rhagoletis zephyria]XP_017480021.1 PREDICTED: vacuolar protein sorting-associated protein 53 homolog isoform X1 [Rhagoletis zephyria]
MNETELEGNADDGNAIRPVETNRIHFTKDVKNAIDEVLKTEDPMDSPDFNTVDYINQLFPNEQSLVSIDETIQRMQCEVSLIDDNIRAVVRGQTNTGQDGQMALTEAQKVISTLYAHIIDVKTRAEKTEEMVKEITRDIKQLDCAKRNLTSAITTLNHLHMLVGGIESLNKLIEKRLYGEILNPLQAITEVNQHFKQYSDIEEIKNLSQNVDKIQVTLAKQITDDFKEAFSTKSSTATSAGNKHRLGLNQLADACKVISVLDPKVKKDLLKWFIAQQLEEYVQLFHENQDIAWLDKIDKRYAWLKRHLLDFEDKFGAVFPLDWEVSERITVEFCRLTREQLSHIMAKRSNEIDVRLLLFAINKTQAFEQLLSKRFTGVTLGAEKLLAPSALKLLPESGVIDPNAPPTIGLFHDQIGSCFKAHLGIYIKSIDRNLSELMEKFVEMAKEPLKVSESRTTVYPRCMISSADLFVFYKKCMVQCNQLSNEQPMYELALVFKKYLREYASKVLEFSTPKLMTTTASIGKSMSLLTRDMQNLSTAAGQVFHNFLKEGDTQRFPREDLIQICCVLTTAEYCLETVQQLEDKLKEKVSAAFVNKIDMSEEKDVFHRIISNCIQLLVQDLEAGCEPSLQSMSKVQWQSISNVGDQSGFINSMCANFKQTVPVIRDNLATSRKYFTQFCHKFVNAFIPKFISVLYKCKLTHSDGSNNVLGCEQLLLDTHSLKTALLDLPSIGSSVNRKAPTSYTKVVVKDMTRAEMIIKVVMTPVQPPAHFTQQVLKLLPDITIAEYQKILDMKAVKRVDQLQLIDLFKHTASHVAVVGSDSPELAATNVESGAAPAQGDLQSNEDQNTTTAASKDTTDSGDAPYTAAATSTPKRAFIFSVGSFTGGAEKNADGTSNSGGDRGRIRKLESLLKKRLP